MEEWGKRREDPSYGNLENAGEQGTGKGEESACNRNLFRSALLSGSSVHLLARVKGHDGMPTLVGISQTFGPIGWSDRDRNRKGGVQVTLKAMIRPLSKPKSLPWCPFKKNV